MNKLQTIIKKIKSMFSSTEEPTNTKSVNEVGTRVNGQLFVTLDDSKQILSKSNPQPTPEMQQTVADAMRESMIVAEYNHVSEQMLEHGISVKEKNELIGTRQDAVKLPVVDEQEYSAKASEKHESILRKTGPAYGKKMPLTPEELERKAVVDAKKQEMKIQIDESKKAREKALKTSAKNTKSNPKTSKTKTTASKRRKSK